MPARWCGTRSEPALRYSPAHRGRDSWTERAVAERGGACGARGDIRDSDIYRGARHSGVPGSSRGNFGNQWAPETKRKLRQREEEE